MKTPSIKTRVLFVSIALCASIAWGSPSPARADDTPTQTSGNALVLTGGLLVGIPYLTGTAWAIAGATHHQTLTGPQSNGNPNDVALFAPVAGPFVDDHVRQKSSPLLLVDGATQSVGVAAIIAGLVLKEISSGGSSSERAAYTEKKNDSKKFFQQIAVAPSTGGTAGTGLVISGTFQ